MGTEQSSRRRGGGRGGPKELGAEGGQSPQVAERGLFPESLSPSEGRGVTGGGGGGREPGHRKPRRALLGLCLGF